jgi:hypothetical protein
MAKGAAKDARDAARDAAKDAARETRDGKDAKDEVMRVVVGS